MWLVVVGSEWKEVGKDERVRSYTEKIIENVK